MTTSTTNNPMTDSQKRELDALCRKTGERVEADLTRDQANCRIEALRNLDSLPRP